MIARNSLLCLWLGALLLAAAPAHADSKSGHHDSSKHVFFKKVHFILLHESDLDLANEQVDNIKTLLYNTKKALIKQDADIKLLGLDIRTGLKADEPDLARVNALIDQQYSLKAAEAKIAAEAYVTLKGLLSADQLDKTHTLWLDHQHSEAY